jgi:hypothetical protein
MSSSQAEQSPEQTGTPSTEQGSSQTAADQAAPKRGFWKHPTEPMEKEYPPLGSDSKKRGEQK